MLDLRYDSTSLSNETSVQTESIAMTDVILSPKPFVFTAHWFLLPPLTLATKHTTHARPHH